MEINIEDYKRDDSGIDYNRFNAELKKLREENYKSALATFSQAQDLARVNGAFLMKCTEWHFKLKVGKHIYHLYPNNQRIHRDYNFQGPFLDVAKPWNFIDVVMAALLSGTLKPKQIIEMIKG